MSSTTLADLRAVAHNLDDDRITIRKNHDDKLRTMLSNNRIVAILNDSTLQDKGGTSFTWTSLFVAVIRYVAREVDRMKADVDKSASSQTAMLVKKNATKLEKLKMAPIGLLQQVIRTANKIQPLIKCETLVDHMIAFLNRDNPANSFMRLHFGAKAVQILLERVLSDTVYRSEIRVGEENSGNHWKKLLQISMEIFLDVPEKLDFHMCVKFFRTVVIEGCRFTCTRNQLRKELKNLESILKSTKLENSSVDTKTTFLEGLNRIMMELSYDYRSMVCAFGEKVVSSIIGFSGDEREIDKNVIKFIIHQIGLHHPKGATSEEEGATFSDRESWHHILLKIYTNLIDTTIRNQLRANRSKIVRVWKIRDDLVELAALVSRQLFFGEYDHANGSEISVTQLVPLNVTQMPGTSMARNDIDDSDDEREQQHASKRRKIQIGLEISILDKLSRPEKQEENYIPWLQIIERILAKYPSVLVSEANVPKTLCVFRSVLDLLQTCRNLEVKQLLLSCINLIIDLKNKNSSSEPLEKHISSEFVKLWETTLNIVSLNQCVQDGHSLLRSLLGQANTEQLSKLYGLYLNKLIVCNEYSVTTLLKLLIHSPQIPEVAASPADLFSSQSLSQTQHSAESGRVALLEWLWPRKRSSNDNQEMTTWTSLRKSHPRLVAALLTMFAVRVESEEGRQFLLRKVENGLQDSTSKTEFDSFLREMAELETIVIETSLLSSQTGASNEEDPSSKPSINCLSIISRIKLTIHDSLVQETGEISSLLSEKNKSSSEIVGDCVTSIEAARFNVLYLKTFYDWGISQTDAKTQRMTNRMIDILQGLLDKTCVVFIEMISANQQSDPSTFGSDFDILSSSWIGFLRDLRSFLRDDPKMIRLIHFDAFVEMFKVILDVVVMSGTTKLNDLLCNQNAIKSGAGSTQTQNVQRTQRNYASNNGDIFEASNDDIEFMDEDEKLVDNHSPFDDDEEDNFVDQDSQVVEAKALESLLRNALYLLAEMSTASSPDIRADVITLLVQTLSKIFKGFERMSKSNRRTFQFLSRFLTETLFQVLETVITESPTVLDVEVVSEIMTTFQSVARFCLHPIARKNTPSYFDPTVCSLVLRALTQILRHIEVSYDATSSVSDNGESSLSRLNTCRKNYVTFVTNLVKIQAGTLYQVFSTELELELVDLVGQITRADPTGKWAQWSGDSHNMCSRDEREGSVDAEETVPISLALLRFATHPFYRVRNRAVKNLRHLFSCQPKNVKAQDLSEMKLRTLSQLYDYLSNLCNITFSADEVKYSSDERHNRYATFLIAMSNVALCYPSLERETVARIVAPLNTYQIPLSQLKLVFENLALEKTFDGSTISYMEPMLPFVLKEFLKQDKSWTDFPFQLLGCDSERTFATKYENILLPILLWFGKSNNDSTIVSEKTVELSIKVGKDVRQLLSENFADLVAYFLPTYVAADKNVARGMCSKKRISRSQQIYKFCDEILTTKKYFSLLNEFIPEILSKILKQVQDPEDLAALLAKNESLEQSFIESILPMNQTSDPPSTNTLMIENLIQFFGEIASEEKSLFSQLVDNFPDCLQRILQDICGPLKSKNPGVLPKLRALHGLNIFVDSIAKELVSVNNRNDNANNLQNQLPFVSLFLLHTLLDFVVAIYRKNVNNVPTLNWEESAVCIFIALEVLKKVSDISIGQKTLQSCTKRLVMLLSNTLVPLISELDDISTENSPDIWSQTIVNIRNVALKVLTSSLTMAASLGSRRRYIDPLPTTRSDIFRQLEQTLYSANSVESSSNDDLASLTREFVQKGKIPFCGMTKTLHRKEGLERLLIKLQSGRKELHQMLVELANSPGFSEEAAASSLHQLIVQLINLSCSKNPDISAMANRCLGEIGPLNLNTLLLNPMPKSDSRCVVILRLLLEYVVNEDEATSSAAALALKYVMQTTEGREGLDVANDPELSILMKPFSGCTISSATFDPFTLGDTSNDFDLNNFTRLVDRVDLWSPEHITSSDDWISKIVETLLATLPKLKISNFKNSSILGRHLSKLCLLQPHFAQEIFPLFIHDLLLKYSTSQPQVRKILSHHVSLFFEKHFISTGVKKNNDASYNDISSVRMMLAMCGHLRLCDISTKAENTTLTVWQNNFWLVQLNYLHLAQAALHCSDFFAVILYSDIWCQRLLEFHPDLEKRFAVSFDSSNLLNFLHENLQEKEELIADIKVCQKLLAEAHQNLGDMDAIHGCGDDRLLDDGARIEQLMNEKKLYKAMGMFDERLAVYHSAQGREMNESLLYEKGLLSSLLGTGFYHTMSGYIQGSKNSSCQNKIELLNYQYECAWRLGRWDTLADDDVPNLSERDGSAFSRHRFLALDSLLGENGNELEFARYLNLAGSEVSSELARLKSCESACASIAGPLVRLRALRELEVVAELLPKLGKGFDLDRNLRARVSANLEQLRTYSSDLLFSTETSSDFDNSEPILAQRCIALTQMSNRQRMDHVTESPVKKRQTDLLEVRKLTTRAYAKHALELSQVARQNDRFQIAHNSLNRLKELLKDVQMGGKFANVMDEVSWQNLDLEIRYEEAQLLWDWKEKDHAKRQLKSLLQTLRGQERNSGESSLLLPEVLGTLGAWMFDLRTESASSIMDKYLTEAVRIFETMANETGSQVKMVEAYANLGKFCDDQHQQLWNYMQSKDFEDKQNLMAQIREESISIKNIGTTAKDTRQATVILDRNTAIDNSEVERLKADKLRYLLGALQNYSNALSLGTRHDLKTFRLISLWFSNLSDEKVNHELSEWLSKVPSYKFIGLLYQLCARLITQPVAGVHAKNFPDILFKLISRCTKEHPYHALPIIMALANSDADQAEIDAAQSNGKPVQKRFRDETGSPKTSKTTGSGMEERTMAAKRILEFYRKLKPDLVRDVENLSLSLIKLAYTTEGRKLSGGRVEIAKNHPIRKIQGLERVPIPTLNIEVNPEGNYPMNSFVGVVEYNSEFQMVGGINAPKKVSCRGTDGKWRPSLVKGKDDLRQDAVMQQVFGLMNTLLRNDPNTTKRRLQIRQYKVVPLSQRSGVLEWCENTIVMKDFLVGNDNEGGAHKRYHPNDLPAPQCRKVLADGQKPNSKHSPLKVFLEICGRFKPAMKYFFFENFPSPGLYIERRLAYSRSTATSSMIGYILGLGDRHVQNILIDKKTAEIIHIDLGIAFEQGRILPTPETIPFRLTRDVVDGLGPSGVEGTFRMCCEATMKVLRSHKDEVMTILEVMMFDPLYNWSLTPAKAYRLQNGKEADANLKAKWESEAKRKREQEGKSSSGSNKMAERVLLRVSQKLNGSEEGSYLSIEGQVNSLIQQARDPQRLCSVFVGWQPYM